MRRRRRDRSIDEAIRREELLIQRYQQELLASERSSSPFAPRGSSLDVEPNDELSKAPRRLLARDDTHHDIVNVLPRESQEKPSSSVPDARRREDEESVDTDELWSLLVPTPTYYSSRPGSADRSEARRLDARPPPSDPEKQTEEVDPRLLRLQARMVGFDIRDVEYVAKTDVTTASYRFRVRFLEDEQLGLDLVVEFWRQREASPARNGANTGDAASPRVDDDGAGGSQRRSSRRRIASVRVQFSRKWIQDELHREGILLANNVLEETTDLPSLLSGAVAYLAFDRKRRDFLGRHAFVNAATDESSRSLLRVPLLKQESHMNSRYASLDQSNHVQWLHLSWGWCWKTGKDVLKMEPPHLEGLDGTARGLEKLIEVTGSCEEAIVVILNLPPPPPERKVTKRRRDASALTPAYSDDDDDDSDDPIEHAGMSEYELQRQVRIRRNEQRLRDLGLIGPSKGRRRKH